MDGRGPYGLACQNCAKGKVKCIAMPDGDGCQRCHRLKKPCRPPHGVRKRESQFLQSSLIEEMDAKLDSVLSLLQSVYEQPSSPNSASQSRKGTTSPELQSSSKPASAPLLPQPNIQHPPLMAGYSLTSPEPRDPEAALGQFRGSMLRFCPFIYLPPDLTAPKLQQERPFLFEAILAVTTRSVQERLAWSKRIKSTISYALVLENQSNIDLLLGLLTYAAWSQDHHLTRMSTLSRLMELAVSIVNDLNLNKPAPPDAHRLAELGGGHDPNLSRRIPKTRTAEEKRAVMGCFLLSSIVSSYFFQMEPMRWTQQMEQDLVSLEATSECPSDAALVIYVRLQLLVQNATKLRDEHTTPLHISFFLRNFRTQLESIRHSIPGEFLKEDLILAQLYYAELSIHETAFTANFDPESPNSNRPIGSEAIDCLWHSLLAIRSWVSVYYRMTGEDHTRFTIITWVQLSRALVTLYRLSVHPAADWNRDAVEKTVSLADVFNHIRSCFGQLSPSPGEPFPDDFWARASLLGRAIEAWIHTSGRLNSHADASTASTTAADAQPPVWSQSECIADGGQALPPWEPASDTHHLQPLHDSFQYGNQVSAVWLERMGVPPGDPSAGMQF
ncbi:hypothetical protein BDW75DRAFT_225674 [Aspergillus navahoensis]